MRSPSALCLPALLTLSSVLGFKDTSPLLIWSSTPGSLREAPSHISSGVVPSDDAYRTMSRIGCDWETVVVIHADDLHQSHLQSLTLPSTSPADLHIPYVVRPTRRDLDSAVEEWAQICGAAIADGFDGVRGGRTVVRLDAKKGDDILYDLAELPHQADLIILTGTSTNSSPVKRQDPYPQDPDYPQEPPYPSITLMAPSNTSGINSTAPTDGPLLDRVQLLTTPIITALLITFGLFVPIIGFGVSALVGIQVPPRMMEISKGMIVGKDRKDQ